MEASQFPHNEQKEIEGKGKIIGEELKTELKEKENIINLKNDEVNNNIGMENQKKEEMNKKGAEALLDNIKKKFTVAYENLEKERQKIKEEYDKLEKEKKDFQKEKEEFEIQKKAFFLRHPEFKEGILEKEKEEKNEEKKEIKNVKKDENEIKEDGETEQKTKSKRKRRKKK